MLKALTLALAIWLLAVTTALAQVPGDPEQLMRDFDKAYVGRDLEAAMALFADDAALDIRPPGGQPIVGKAAIRATLTQLMAGNPRRRMLELRRVGAPEGATARFEVQNDLTRRAGVSRILYTETIEVRGGKIALHRTEFDATDAETAKFLLFRRSLASQAQPAQPAATQLPRTGGAPIGLGLLAGLGLVAAGWRLTSARGGRAAPLRRRR